MKFFLVIGSVLLTLHLQVIPTSTSVIPENLSLDRAGSLNTTNAKIPPSCYDGNVPMVELIPNPYDCHTFYQCREVRPGVTTATLMPCQSGENGAPLSYSFRKCQCDHNDTAECYNMDPDSEDYLEFFTCATPAA